MKKIILISSKDNTFYNFRSEKILKFVELGYDVILVCPYGSKIDYFTERGCKFIDLPMDRRGTSLVNDFKLLLGYMRILRKESPDIVLTYTTKCSVYAGMVCRLLGIKYIVNNAGLIAHDNPRSLFARFMNMLYGLGFKGAACMMYQNAQEREHMNAILKNKVYFRDLPGSGVNLNVFTYRDYPTENSPITFNFVARIAEFKGIREFLECAKRIKEEYPKTRFVIYGDYDDEEYRTKVGALVDTGIVEYGGIQLDMKPAIASAHAVIHPSYYEGMTNVVLEHSAMGRVCIGSDIPGVADGIEDGVTGYTFEVKNADALVDAVRRFIELPYEEKVKMGKAARAKMEREFDRGIVTNIYVEEIEKVIGRA